MCINEYNHSHVAMSMKFQNILYDTRTYLKVLKYFPKYVQLTRIAIVIYLF